ncbi:MAG TPA: sensor domain-containing diguanylate cyclase [Mariprofundaceae bacterium]|nr:sensor domain-containing diguanylate cyclase [Mariprofundaceae bacterium]
MEVAGHAPDGVASLHTNEEKLRRLVDMSREGIVSLDAADNFNFANPHMAKLLGIPVDELVGRPYLSVVASAQQEAVREHLDMRRRGVSESYETVLNRADGSQIDVHISAAALMGEREQYLGSIMVVSDISERKQWEAQIRHMAEHDPLTNLPNRVLFMEHLAQSIRQARRFSRSLALVFIDLDRFKEVNDRFGHQVGDLALVEAANRMRRVIRDIDVLCRHGGDEFILLFSEIASADNVDVLLEKIRAAFQAPFAMAGHTFELSVSMGVTIYPDHATEINELIRLADQAMYIAKKHGGNSFLVYTPDDLAA